MFSHETYREYIYIYIYIYTLIFSFQWIFSFDWLLLLYIVQYNLINMMLGYYATSHILSVLSFSNRLRLDTAEFHICSVLK
jgi:hypothetical protein